MPRLVFVPSLRRSWGTGHLVRCLRWLKGGPPGWSLFLPRTAGANEWDAAEILQRYPGQLEAGRIVHEIEPDAGWDFVVLDRRMTSLEELERFARRYPVIGIDEGGPARTRCSLLIDTFPRVGPPSPANIADEGLVADVPPEEQRRPDFPDRIRKVLLCFGGEDARDLTRRTWQALLDWKLSAPADMDVALGPAYRHPAGYPGSRTFIGRTDISTIFREYDLVLASFGLTAYEALRRRVPVLLVNPGSYHRRLARRAGFPEAGVGRPERALVARCLGRGLGELIEALERKAAGLADVGMPAVLARLEGGNARGCPLCGRGPNTALERYPGKSYFRCGRCGLVYLEAFSRLETVYDENYFFAEYRRQYGRTYLEDFDSIKLTGKKRLSVIKKLLAGGRYVRRERRLLDVGCAYGPFLAAAAEDGFDVQGVDVSTPAVSYVRERLGFKAVAGDFPGADVLDCLGPGEFDVISLWYVIEHFRQLGRVLTACNRLLRRGGLLVLGSPHGAGGSARLRRRSFLEASPPDHYSVWDPSSARCVLGLFGFSIRKVRMTGHHPERLPGLRQVEKLLGGRPALGLSRLAGLGDTFEVYAEKTRDIAEAQA